MWADMDTLTQDTPIHAFPEALLAYRLAARLKNQDATRAIWGSTADSLRRFGRHVRFFDPEITIARATAARPASLSSAREEDHRDWTRALLLICDRRPGLALLPADLLNVPILSIENFRAGIVSLSAGDEVDRTDLIEALVARGYERVSTVRSPLTFAVRGSLVDLFPPQDDRPARLDFDDVRIARLRAFDPQTQESLQDLKLVRVPPGRALLDDPADPPSEARATLRDWLAGCRVYRLAEDDPRDDLPGTPLSLFPVEGSGERLEEPAMPPGMDAQVEEIRKLWAGGWTVALGMPADLCRRVGDFFKDKKLPFEKLPPGSFPDTCPVGLSLIEGDLPSGFRDNARKLMLLSATDLCPRRRQIESAGEPPAPVRGYAARAISDVLELAEGDYVVHEQYGIGIFRGLKRIKTREEEGEYLAVEYRDKDILYVPLDKFHMVQKYIGSGRRPKPHRLGEAAWQKIKQTARKKIEAFARDLLGLYASREHHSGFAFSQDNVYQHEFEMRFTFEETADQTRAITEVKRDMEAPKPMDRLVCGDAGFGKTEVALRAAFKATLDGKQVAVVVPTTLLAEQHRLVFEERFQGFAAKIAGLSRFKARAEQAAILQQLRSGEIDICVGTHRLLQDDVSFRDLGLIIIDEEHRFGVRQKERLKFYRQFVDVISMSATPIPRTLYMSLIGSRDISVIETPPRLRVPIHTDIFAYDPRLIREATVKEMLRGGQVFFLYNRVETIDRAADWIRRAVPEARIGIAHGQMTEEELETVMQRFYRRELDVLVTTTIIESGLDLPNANTIFIFDAERFGLSTLYQLRGRVGRSDRQAYCYLLTPEGSKPMTAKSRRRLEAIAAIAGVGGGYRVALEDLTLRGAGNLLGPEQHGIVWEIGFEMYCEMLRSAIVELKGEQQEPPWNVRIDVKLPQFIPEDLLPESSERIALYRRIARCRSARELKETETRMLDRFGDLPPPVLNLLRVRLLKFVSKEFLITEVIEWSKSLSVYTDDARAVIHQTARIKPMQVTPRQIEYNLRGMTADLFLQKLLNALSAGLA